MKRLTEREDAAIRNMLDNMGDRLYHDVVIPSDAYWAHTTIKRLLLDIYVLQIGMKEREIHEEDGNIGQPTVADFSNKPI